MARSRGRTLHPIERADIKIAATVALDGRTVAGRRMARFAELGDQPPMRLLCGAVIAASVVRRDRRLFRTGLRMLTAHSIATLAKAFVKDGVNRTRPGEALGSGSYRLAAGNSRAHELQSMPSGHSAGVVAVASAAISEYPIVAGPAVAATVAVLGAQLPSRNHFLSDVAVGSAIGLAAFGIARAVLPPLDASSRVD